MHIGVTPYGETDGFEDSVTTVAARPRWCDESLLSGVCPGTVGLAGGGAAAGLGAGLGQIVATVLTLAVIGFVIRWRTTCSTCER